MVHICIIILKCLSLIAQGKKKISYRLIIVTGNSNPAHFEPDATALKKLRTRQLVFHSECASHTHRKGNLQRHSESPRKP